MSRQREKAGLSDPAPQPFMTLLVAGQALLGDIEEHVAAWHDAAYGSPAASQALHDYLGMTRDEYRLWVEHPESLRFIAAAHKANLPVGTVLGELDGTGVAARTGEQTEARNLLRWLEKTGRIQESHRPW